MIDLLINLLHAYAHLRPDDYFIAMVGLFLVAAIETTPSP